DILAFEIAGLPKSLAKCGKVGGRLRRRPRAQEPDHRRSLLLRARSKPGSPHRSMSASTTRPVRHNVPSQLSIFARPHQHGLIRSWRADSLCLRVARSVWTGRALQAESDDLEVIGLALLYPALERNVCVPGHHGYPRASDLILGKAHRGRSCHQIMDATARPFLHLFIPARRPRRESRLMLLGSA